MIWITEDEIRVPITDQHLSEIIEDTPAILTTAETTAISLIRGALFSRYDVDVIFSTTGSNRNATVMRWATVIIIYLIYERIPDRLTPERVLNDYKETMKHLKDVETNSRNIDLPVMVDPITDDAFTNTRWGSRTRRTH